VLNISLAPLQPLDADKRSYDVTFIMADTATHFTNAFDNAGRSTGPLPVFANLLHSNMDLIFPAAPELYSQTVVVTSIMGDARVPLEIPENRDTSAAIFTVLITNMQVSRATRPPPLNLFGWLHGPSSAMQETWCTLSC
jgi:hypothetical protein